MDDNNGGEKGRRRRRYLFLSWKECFSWGWFGWGIYKREGGGPEPAKLTVDKKKGEV